jgi:hypothetical protein
MNSADHAVLALSLDPEFQSRINLLAGRGLSANPGSRPPCRVLVGGRRFTRADPCFFGELKSRMVS